MVSPTSTLIDDWIAMDTTYEQVKYYSSGSVRQIARIVSDKWLSISPNCFEFVKLSHVSALMVFIFKDLQSILDRKELKLEEHDLVKKYCALIEVFGFNTINQLLYEKLNGATILFDILAFHIVDEKQSPNLDLIADILMGTATCLRLTKLVPEFLKMKPSYIFIIVNNLQSNL